MNLFFYASIFLVINGFLIIKHYVCLLPSHKLTHTTQHLTINHNLQQFSSKQTQNNNDKTKNKHFATPSVATLHTSSHHQLLLIHHIRLFPYHPNIFLGRGIPTTTTTIILHHTASKTPPPSVDTPNIYCWSTMSTKKPLAQQRGQQANTIAPTKQERGQQKQPTPAVRDNNNNNNDNDTPAHNSGTNANTIQEVVLNMPRFTPRLEQALRDQLPDVLTPSPQTGLSADPLLNPPLWPDCIHQWAIPHWG